MIFLILFYISCFNDKKTAAELRFYVSTAFNKNLFDASRKHYISSKYSL
ncbi:hypothetical protein EH2_00113 [Bacillus subtilis]|nr:hypothetical protein EH2_00113 [Bacillus subtilis]